MYCLKWQQIFAAMSLAILLTGCGGRGSPAPAPNGGATAVAGDSQVTINWTPDAGVEYWLFYVAGNSISSDNPTSTPGHKTVTRVSPPYVLTGLTNGATYAFTVNGRTGGGPGGAGTPSVAATPRPAGVTWNSYTSLGAADLHGIAYGTTTNTLTNYMAVGNNGAAFRSTDGATWVSAPTGSAANLNGVTFAFNNFIAVGTAGAILLSADASTWSPATSSTAQNLNAVATNGSLVVAVGDAGTIRYSSNGVNWNTAALVPTANPLYGVTYASSGIWLAVGASGTLITSPDGSTWSSATSGTTSDLRAVTFRAATGSFAATYVAVGLGGKVLTSPDAGTWTSQTVSPAPPSPGLLAVVPYASQFLTVGAGGSAFTSPDGVTWTPQTTGSSANLYGLINAQVQYVAVGQTGANLISK